MYLSKKNENFNLYLKSIDAEQVFIIASVINEAKDSVSVCKEIYCEVVNLLLKYNISVFHERIFGSTFLYEEIRNARSEIFKENNIDTDIPLTFVDGKPFWGEGISGINIHGVILKNEYERISNIEVNNEICGRLWENEQSKYLILQSVYSKKNMDLDAFNQTIDMFGASNEILERNGFKFGNVIRTWIYLYEVLKQYGEFNKARNLKFKEFGLIPDEIGNGTFEKIYMPASTGIDCNNVFRASGIMDVLAIKTKENSNLTIHSETGRKQKSAFRYGSAFSRAMITEDDKSKYIFLSGTASINEKGETVYIDDIKQQIEMTVSVIDALAKNEDLHFSDICEATVFLKKAEYISEFREFCCKNGFSDLPFIIVVADVCRDDLLFEIDATLAGSKNSNP